MSLVKTTFKKTFSELQQICNIVDCDYFEEIYVDEDSKYWKINGGSTFEERLDGSRASELITAAAFAKCGASYCRVIQKINDQIHCGDLEILFAGKVYNVDVKNTAEISMTAVTNLMDGTLVCFNSRSTNHWFIIEIQDDTRTFLRGLPKITKKDGSQSVLVKFTEMIDSNISHRLVTDKFPGYTENMRTCLIAAQEQLDAQLINEESKRTSLRLESRDESSSL